MRLIYYIDLSALELQANERRSEIGDETEANDAIDFVSFRWKSWAKGDQADKRTVVEAARSASGATPNGTRSPSSLISFRVFGFFADDLREANRGLAGRLALPRPEKRRGRISLFGTSGRLEGSSPF